MTGYGMAQAKIGHRRIALEVKSVNHKYCEINLRLPPRYSTLEGRIVEFAKNYFQRGRIDILVREDNTAKVSIPVKIDWDRLKFYHGEIKRISRSLGISSEVQMDTLLSLPHVILLEEEENLTKVWRILQSSLGKAFHSLEKMRAKEGAGIGRFLETQVKSLHRHALEIQSRVSGNVQHYRNLLKERIDKLAGGIELDSQKLAQEVAYFVDRTDISEELQRLNHHVKHFREILKEKGPQGRKLDFLLQEMNREVNTLSSKAQNAMISKHVVESKHLLEKMREQVQNVE